MYWVSGAATFIMIWWMLLFIVLPWGIEHDPESGQIGAPKAPQLLKKFIITTCLSIVVWGGVYALVVSPYISFREMAKEMPLQ